MPAYRPHPLSTLVSAVTFLAVLACSAVGGGREGEVCSSADDCADGYTCVYCSIQNTCFNVDASGSSVLSANDREQACTYYGDGYALLEDTGSGGGGGDCSDAWTCDYDGQATTTCQYACTLSGSERDQTCDVLASMVTSGDAGECCPVCR